MKKFLKRVWNETEAQDLAEVALLLVCVALAAVSASTTLSNGLKTAFQNAAAGINNAGAPAGGGGGNASQ